VKRLQDIGPYATFNMEKFGRKIDRERGPRRRGPENE
jgi:hypothetical protein